MTLPSVLILATGGTIAASARSPGSTTHYALSHGVEATVAAVPQIHDVARITAEQIANVASQEIDNPLLLKLARRINAVLASDDVDGVVVTHGTDTMEETAYFLGLVIKSRKPVVLVGAMRPSTAPSADGPMNLINAVTVAASALAAGKGVLVVLNNRILSARHAVKSHVSALDAFRSLDGGCLGSIVDNHVQFDAQPLATHTTDTDFDIHGVAELPRVDIVYAHQGIDTSLFDAAIAAGARGIVFAATGNGTLSEAAKRGAATARRHGVAFVRSTRVGGGAVCGHPVDDELGTIAGNSLNPQKARILLSLALSLTTDHDRLQTYFDEY